MEICRAHTGEEIRWSDTEEADSPLKLLWNHSDAILCCSLKVIFVQLYSVILPVLLLEKD